MLFRHSENGRIRLGPRESPCLSLAFILNVAPWAFATFAVRAYDWSRLSRRETQTHWEIPDIRFRGLSIIRRDNEMAGARGGQARQSFNFAGKRN